MVYVKPADCKELIYVPNAFSPNEDVENDLFRVYFINITCVQELKIDIYDRWGELVFQSLDPAFGWAGEYKGKMMDTQVFSYYLHVVFRNGDEVDKKGNISLVR
jgi:gliding motility-associated-like protein